MTTSSINWFKRISDKKSYIFMTFHIKDYGNRYRLPYLPYYYSSYLVIIPDIDIYKLEWRKLATK